MDALDIPCDNDSSCLNKVYNNFTMCIKNQCKCYDHNGVEAVCKLQKISASNVIGGKCPCPIAHSVCDQLVGLCICSEEFIMSQDKRKCIPKSVHLGEKCEDNSQCLSYTENSECDLEENICHCQGNFTQYEDTCQSFTGLGGRCRQSAECLGRAQNSVCQDHRCMCAINFVARRNRTECLPVAHYGEPCSEPGQCQQTLGNGGVCNDGLCVCDAAHQNISLGGHTICEKKISVGDTCKDHGQCYHSHPLKQTMECISGQCQCIEGFSVESQQCTENSANSVKIVTPVFLLICMIVHKILN
ncbi:tenascin-like isoform X2 [Phlebotomus argentipes]|uniref:tenascin-like isoform X2 n=1 Tax=Phlebotomus argentipes TaxID=94469 RepID=UPI002892D18B|nr:tenascin-like isoform X2 [Phlebotomus argentipes]